MNDLMDRYARGELTPLEARELAQASLQDEELFEELSSTAVANAAVSNPRAMKIRRFPGRSAAVAAIAASVVIAVSLYALRSERPAAPSQPILLAAAAQSSEVFRSGEAAPREPRESGAILSIEDGEASIDLGSMDGLVKGMQLDGLIVTTLFRDHARAKISGAARAGDRVQVPVSAHLSALLSRADSTAKAQSAIDWARSHGVTAEAAAALATQSAGPAMMNNLGAIAELAGDRKKAASIYAGALPFATSTEDRQAISANLARVRAR